MSTEIFFLVTHFFSLNREAFVQVTVVTGWVQNTSFLPRAMISFQEHALNCYNAENGKHAFPMSEILYRGQKNFYYINTNEIPSGLSRENVISSHLKKSCYFHT